MANVKISQLASAGSLAGTEVLPVVQGGTTKKVTVQAIADLAGGGGGLPGLEMITVGSIGANTGVSYNINAYPSATGTGTQSIPLEFLPNINFGSGGYGAVAPSLSSIIFPTLTKASGISFSGFSNLTTVSAPLLEEILGSLSFGSGVASLATLNFPSLKSTAYGISLSSDIPFTVSTVNFNSLTFLKLSCYASYGGVQYFNATTFPAVTTIALNSNARDIISVNLPSVTTIGDNSQAFSLVSYYSGGVLTEIIFANTVSMPRDFFATGQTVLTTVTLGTVGVLKRFDGYVIDLTNNALNEASVDGAFTLMASLDGTNDTQNASGRQLKLNGGTNAAPSSVGLAAKDILLARGWYISHN